MKMYKPWGGDQTNHRWIVLIFFLILEHKLLSFDIWILYDLLLTFKSWCFNFCTQKFNCMQGVIPLDCWWCHYNHYSTLFSIQMKWRTWTTKKKQLEIISTHQHDTTSPIMGWWNGVSMMTLVSTGAFGDECGSSHFKQLDLGL